MQAGRSRCHREGKSFPAGTAFRLLDAALITENPHIAQDLVAIYPLTQVTRDVAYREGGDLKKGGLPHIELI